MVGVRGGDETALFRAVTLFYTANRCNELRFISILLSATVSSRVSPYRGDNDRLFNGNLNNQSRLYLYRGLNDRLFNGNLNQSRLYLYRGDNDRLLNCNLNQSRLYLYRGVNDRLINGYYNRFFHSSVATVGLPDFRISTFSRRLCLYGGHNDRLLNCNLNQSRLCLCRGLNDRLLRGSNGGLNSSGAKSNWHWAVVRRFAG
jgi:hypothetical protein